MYGYDCVRLCISYVYVCLCNVWEKERVREQRSQKRDWGARGVSPTKSEVREKVCESCVYVICIFLFEK